MKPGSKTSFLKKRSKKLLIPGGFHVAGQIPHSAAGAGGRRFLLLFFKKEVLPS